MKKPDFIFEKPEESTGFLLWQVTNLWQREIKKALEKYGLTHTQFVLMATIYWLKMNKQKSTQITLSNFTKIDPMSTSTVLRTLQKKDLILRKEHDTDTRAKTVELSAFGEETIKNSIKTVEEFDRVFFGKLANETAEFNEKLIRLLENKSGF